MMKKDPVDNQPWDFTVEAKRRRAEELVRKSEPWILIGCPPCTDYSQIQNLNWKNMTEWVVQRRKTAARVHIEFVVGLYRIQHEAGRLFVHEHPWAASSWKEPAICQLSEELGITKVRGDMCRFGMTQITREGKEELVKKGTGFLTNSPQVAKELSKVCNGGHPHVELKGGDRCRRAQVYPVELSRAMCRGAAREKEFRNQGLYAIGAVQIDQAGNVDPKKLYEGEHEEDMEGEIEVWPEAEKVWPE